nr:outer membrane beta-barrel protein [Neorhizobium galegae]
MRKILSFAFASTLLTAGLAYIAPAQAADMTPATPAYVAPVHTGGFEISGYGGYQFTPHSDVDVSDGPDFAAGWDTKPFAMPPYWGIRGTYWFDGGALTNWGVSLDYTHAKVYADDETMVKAGGWSVFEFTDGLNLLTLNALYKFPIEGSKWTPYVGAGVGINVPHVEVTRASGRTFEYQFGGATLQAQAGIRYQFTEKWSGFAEYKGNYSFVDVDIDSGASLKTNILTHAINLGVSYKF